MVRRSLSTRQDRRRARLATGTPALVVVRPRARAASADFAGPCEHRACHSSGALGPMTDNSPPDTEERRPLVFVSWAHDDDQWTDDLVTFVRLLREDGINASIDLYDKNNQVDWQLYGPEWIDRSDKAIVVTSSTYVERWLHKSPPGVGAGVGREAVVMRHLADMDPRKLLEKVFIAVLPGVDFRTVPSDIAHLPRVMVSELTRDGIDGVFRQVMGDAEFPRPPLGPLRLRGQRERGTSSGSGASEHQDDGGPGGDSTDEMVTEVKRLLAAGKAKIELRDLLMGDVRRLRDFLETVTLENPSDLTARYRQRVTEVVRQAQALAGGLAAGCFYGEAQNRQQWVEVLRSVAQQSDPVSGAVWTRWVALRRLPATMLLYAGMLGAWRAEDVGTLLALSSVQLRHSFSAAPFKTEHLAECAAYVALAPPEVLDQDQLGIGPAGGPIQLSNEIWYAVSPTLTDIYPVFAELAFAFEDVEYLLALMQYDWHERCGERVHTRWKEQRFHSGLINVRGGYVGASPPGADIRFANRHEGSLSPAKLIEAGLVGGDWNRLHSAASGVNRTLPA